MQPVRDVMNHAVTRRVVERKRATQIFECRVRTDGPGNDVQPPDRAAPRQEMADDCKGEQVAENIRARQERNRYRDNQRDGSE